MKLISALPLTLSLFALTAGLALAETVWLDDLDLKKATQGWSEPHKNQSLEGNTLTLGGNTFEHGLGTHAVSTLNVNLAGGSKKFTATVGVDDEVGTEGSVEFFVIGDGKELWKSGVLHGGDAAKTCEVDLTGVKQLTLKAGDAGDGIKADHADWADAKFEVVGEKPVTEAVETAVKKPSPVAGGAH